MIMIKLALSFLLGVLLFQTCRELPSLSYLFLFPILVLFWLKIPQTLFALIILLGFSWTHLFAYHSLNPQISSDIVGNEVNVKGHIVELKTYTQEYSQFIFKLLTPSLESSDALVAKKVLLSWYQPKYQLRKGQLCHLTVKLKKPWGFSNPGAWDYEKTLFLQGITARGYVRQGTCQLAEIEVRKLSHLRESWINNFLHKSANYDNAAFMQALTFAYRENITDQHWNILRKTGTAHLLAISGLHLSAVAFIVFLVIQKIYCMSATLCNVIPARTVAAVAAIFATLFYAYLAGFTLPTQRALIMVALALSAILLRRPMFSLSVYSSALLLVLIINPLAVLTAGFWMSFLAVLFIFIALNATKSLGSKKFTSKLIRIGLIQCYLGVALFPISLLIFSEASIISPLVNLLAIPYVSFIVLPLLLFAQSIFLLGIENIEWLLNLIDMLLAGLWWGLEGFASTEYAAWQFKPTLVGVICFEAGLYILVQAKGFPAKYLAWMLLLAMFALKEPSLKGGQLRMTTLDVGQGLAVVIELPHYTLLYDAGMRSRSGLNTGRIVIQPYLEWRNIQTVDMAIVSHNDNDHAGGMHWLLENTEVETLVVSNEPSLYSARHVTICRAGDQWQSGNVTFHMLHPPDKWQSNDNNRSCVLQISHPAGTILLTGDIEKLAEEWLVEQYGDKLASDLITAPHHGSRSSSSYRFVDRVHPQTVVFSAGYMNRYGFPHATISQRYQDRGTQIVDTIHHGAVTFLFDIEKGIQMQTGHRLKNKRYWHSTEEELTDPIE